jgi:hypothetical protein
MIIKKSYIVINLGDLTELYLTELPDMAKEASQIDNAGSGG